MFIYGPAKLACLFARGTYFTANLKSVVRPVMTMPSRIFFFLFAANFFTVATSCGQVPDWHSVPGARWKALSFPRDGQAGFTLLAAPRTGVTFTNELSEMGGAANRVLQNGSGVAVGDYDQDGRPDLMFGNLEGAVRLYQNQGDFRFKEVTAEAGALVTNRYAHGVVFADIDGDSRLDLLLSTIGQGVVCLLNQGHGKFTNVTAQAGTASPWGSYTLSLADVDGNGTLDLYVANYRTEDIRDRGKVDIHMVQGKLVIPPHLKNRLVILNGRLLEYGEPDILYLNQGAGRFQAVGWTNGIFLDESGQPLREPPLDWGLTASFRDLNDDGWPDLYVCNDFWTPDRIWINDGRGRFQALAKTAIRHVPSSSMGVDMADVDRDGLVDIFSLDMWSRDHRLRKRQMLGDTPSPSPLGDVEERLQVLRSTLFLNRGDGTYADIADYSGVSASDWSWTPVFLDVDLDGYEDLLIPTGHIKDVQDMDANERISALQHPWPKGDGLINFQGRLMTFQEAFSTERMIHIRLYPRLDTPVVAYRNLGNLQFREETQAWGLDQGAIHHGIALADFDGDGDMDFVVNKLNDAAVVYRNNSPAPRVAVRLRGLPPNTEGIGARVRLLDGAVPRQSQEVICGGRYLSGSEPMLIFAAGQARRSMVIEVDWRSGRQSRITDVEPNRLYEIEEPASPLPSPSQNASGRLPAGPPPWFEDVSSRLGHRHAEDPFNDFSLQSSLPKRLSQAGPGVGWFDSNGDGWEDLHISSGKGGSLGIYYNNGRGGFERFHDPGLGLLMPRDQTAVLGWRRPDGSPSLLVGLANYQDGQAAGSCVLQYLTRERRIEESVPQALLSSPPAPPSSAGPLALGDMDGDGQLELFVGGQVVAGHYPESARSILCRWKGDRWELDGERSRLLEKAGLVNSALWTDLEADGFPELVLACEWGPVRVFQNERGRLREATADWGLASLTGWWTGLASGDFNEDGRMDLIAGNWGLNSPYQATPEHPLRLVYGDWAERGIIEMLETEYNPVTRTDVPRRGLNVMSRAIPSLREHYPTHQAFSETTVAEFLRRLPAPSSEVKANTLSSMLFLNRGNRFEAVPLPRQAQFAPVWGVVAADFNGDGHEDAFLSQNFFAVRPEVPRLDAGRGLLLTGDGTGQWKAVPGQVSGIRLYGEQRGAAAADFDRDGRLDLAVGQNGAATALLRNRIAPPGLAVRLEGPKGNPSGIGAVLRLHFGERPGPARQIHAGSGYWSQNSAVALLGIPSPPTRLTVRWPGGHTTQTNLPPGATNLTVRFEEKR